MTIQEGVVDSVDQDQTAENVQSDLWSILCPRTKRSGAYCFTIVCLSVQT